MSGKASSLSAAVSALQAAAIPKVIHHTLPDRSLAAMPPPFPPRA